MKKIVFSLVGAAALFSSSMHAQNTLQVRVNNGNDDAEEEVTAGTMYLTSSDLEMSFDSFVTDDQLIGLRFTGISLPANATIENAYIQFTVDELKANDPCNLQVFVEDNVNPSTYSSISFDISGRSYINDSVLWNPATWVAVDDEGRAQRTPNIKNLVDSILNKPTWTNGNAMAFMIKGTGTRTAEAYDGEVNSAPLLVIEYSLPGEFLLQVLHASDLEGGVNAITDAPAFAAIVDRLEDEYANTVTISSGDNYIPGPFFNAASEGPIEDSLRAILSDFYNTPLNFLGAERGRIDISMMNVIGFDASVFGNHEFDQGEGAVADIILGSGNASNLGWMGAQFPYLSANLDFSGSFLNGSRVANVQNANNFKVDVTNPSAASNTPKIAPASIITVNGEQIGVVGATTQLLAQISSPGGVTVTGMPTMNDMPQLAGVLQSYIDSLTARGVNKIIVATHLQQFALEQALAGLLNDVDIILAGGSDFLLADNTDVLRAGDVAAGVYPFQTLNAQNDSVLIVSTDGEYSYVGRLVVAFDAAGKLLPSSVKEAVSGAYATIPAVVNDLFGSANPYAVGTKGYFVERLANSVTDIVVAKDGNVFGKSAVFLEGRRGLVRTEETNMGNISADANLWVARQFDANVAVSLKNGGGIRAEIGAIDQMNSQLLPPQPNPVAGKDSLEVSQLDIENTLRFNNDLKVVETTPAGLKDLLEHGISNWDGVSTNGQMPQVGGVKFSFDPSAAAGRRIQNMALVDTNGNTVDSVVVNGAVFGDASRVIKMVSLNFLVDNDGDGYPFSTATTNGVDLDSSNVNVMGGANFAAVGSEQDALAEYLLAKHTTSPFSDAETDPSIDERIQVLSLRNDSVFAGTVGLNENESHISVEVYPNPAREYVSISAENTTVTTIEIIALSGQVMLRKEAQEAKINLALNDLKSGIYLVKVNTAHGSTFTKIQVI
jgi:2',3'-cyclic-nucleotide 2'-phosphodiesterase (5'-nucleotidase family)